MTASEYDELDRDDDVEETPLGSAFTSLTPRRQGPIVIVVTLLVTIVVVSLLLREVWYQVQVVKLGYEMTSLHRERRSLMEERRKLTLEAAVNTRTDRMEEVARETLGLEPLRPDQILIVRSDERGAGPAPQEGRAE